MQRLVWLASYPKSGNTWVRLLLEAYNHPDLPLPDINDIRSSLHAASRELFDRVIGVEASDLTASEIDALRPEVYRQLAGEAEESLFLKVHDAWQRVDPGGAIFPADVTRVAVYIVRDPRAVAPSYANHNGTSIDRSIEMMAQGDHALARSRRGLSHQLHQFMGSWSGHVRSWLDQTEMPVHLVRYEDLHAATAATFAGILQAVGLPVDQARADKAVAATAFAQLQAQEEAASFRERPGATERFFRKGQADSWREELTPAQVERIIADHGSVMARLGYLDNPQGENHERDHLGDNCRPFQRCHVQPGGR